MEVGSCVLLEEGVSVEYRVVAVATNCVCGVITKLEFVDVGIGEIGNNHCPNAGIRAITAIHKVIIAAIAAMISRINLTLLFIGYLMILIQPTFLSQVNRPTVGVSGGGAGGGSPPWARIKMKPRMRGKVVKSAETPPPQRSGGAAKWLRSFQ